MDCNIHEAMSGWSAQCTLIKDDGLEIAILTLITIGVFISLLRLGIKSYRSATVGRSPTLRMMDDVDDV